MLLRQNLGRRHQRALPSCIHATRRRQRRHHGFARTDVALQQAVHGYAFLQISGNLSAHALLRSRQAKRQALQQLVVQRALGVGQRLTAKRRRAHGSAHAPGFKLRQLLSQQLLRLQALPRRVAVVFKSSQRHIWCRVM